MATPNEIPAPTKPLMAGCQQEHCSPSSMVDFVRRYNRWRRGDESLTMDSPADIGNALDAVCDRIETLERWVKERDRLQDAVREYRDAKGRYHTQLACERLLSLLPENDLATASADEKTPTKQSNV